MTQFSPSELIQKRAAAFQEADYGFVFDSYHSASMFRQQFPEREDYIRFGWANLGKEFHILKCRILKEDVALPEARVIYYMKLDVSGQQHAYAELAWLRQEEGAWRYHRGQKIEAGELPCPVDQLTFETFSQFDQSTIF